MSVVILLTLIVLVPAALVTLAAVLPVEGSRFVSYLVFPLLLVVVVLVRSVAERGRP